MIITAPDRPFKPIPTEGRFELSVPNIGKHGEVGARVLRGRAALKGADLQDPRRWDSMLIDAGQTKGVGSAPVPSNGREWAQQDTVTSGLKVGEGAPEVIGKNSTTQLYRSGNVQSGGEIYGAYPTTGDPKKDREQALRALMGRAWMEEPPAANQLTISSEGVLGRSLPPAVIGGQTGGSSRPSAEASAWKDDGLFSYAERDNPSSTGTLGISNN